MKKSIFKRIKYKNIILLILIITFLYSTSKIVLYEKDKKNNIDSTEKLIEEVVSKDKESIDFDKLLEINKDVVGWINYNSDKINYPILQSTDNEYYLDVSYDNKHNKNGSIFMDYRNKSFDDRNVVIFGHAMPNGTMFGSLKDVFDEKFFEKKDNNYIKITTPNNEILTYQIFSYYIIKAEEYYITTSFNNNTSFQKFITTIKKRSYKKFEVDLDTNDKILTLSTCHGTGNTKKRKVIHAKRVLED